jgi:hypothetical protein
VKTIADVLVQYRGASFPPPTSRSDSFTGGRRTGVGTADGLGVTVAVAVRAATGVDVARAAAPVGDGSRWPECAPPDPRAASVAATAAATCVAIEPVGGAEEAVVSLDPGSPAQPASKVGIVKSKRVSASRFTRLLRRILSGISWAVLIE